MISLNIIILVDLLDRLKSHMINRNVPFHSSLMQPIEMERTRCAQAHLRKVFVRRGQNEGLQITKRKRIPCGTDYSIQCERVII